MVRDPRVREGTLRRAFGGASMRGGRSTAQASSMAGPEHADRVMERGRPRSVKPKAEAEEEVARAPARLKIALMLECASRTGG